MIKDVIENLKVENFKQSKIIEDLENQCSENAMKLDNEERIELNRLTNENKNLKINLEKSINLCNEVTNRLNNEQSDKETLNSDLRLEIAKERAVSETLRQALIDMQEDKEEDFLKFQKLKEDFENKEKIIESLKLDLEDSRDTFKAIDTIKDLFLLLSDSGNRFYYTIISSILIDLLSF